jgi:hypothetical protein
MNPLFIILMAVGCCSGSGVFLVYDAVTDKNQSVVMRVIELGFAAAFFLITGILCWFKVM